ncbi:hypothetical protein [Heyndrickxia oleronia]|nr:hypothetical protein [Heyndrickxia oleronia]
MFMVFRRIVMNEEQYSLKITSRESFKSKTEENGRNCSFSSV